MFDEPYYARCVSNGDVLRFPKNSFVEDHRVGCGSQLLVLAEPSDSHQHVTMFSGDKGRVDTQMASYGSFGPAAGERSPRSLQFLEREVPEVGLQQLTDVVAKLHVEIAVEDRSRLLPLPARYRDRIPEHVQGWLAEYPGVGVVSRHHSHADAQVTVSAEDVDGTAETRPLRPVADPRANQQRERPSQDQESRSRPHLSRLPAAKPPERLKGCPSLFNFPIVL